MSEERVHRGADRNPGGLHGRHAVRLRPGTRGPVHGQMVQRPTGVFPLRAQRVAAHESVPVGHHQRRRKSGICDFTNAYYSVSRTARTERLIINAAAAAWLVAIASFHASLFPATRELIISDAAGVSYNINRGRYHGFYYNFLIIFSFFCFVFPSSGQRVGTEPSGVKTGHARLGRQVQM